MSNEGAGGRNVEMSIEDAGGRNVEYKNFRNASPIWKKQKDAPAP